MDGASEVTKTTIDAKEDKEKMKNDHSNKNSMKKIGTKRSGLYLRNTTEGGCDYF